MIKGYLRRCLKRLTENDPVCGFLLHSGYVLPCTLNEKNVAVMHLLTSEIIQDILLFSSDTQHIDSKLASESSLDYRTVDHRR